MRERSGAPRAGAGTAPSLLEALAPDRVAVVRALQVGDMLCAVPALRALRAALPDADITLIGLPWALSFVTRFRRYLDGFLAFPGYPGLPEQPPGLERFPFFLSEALDRRFDLVIQMHGSGAITNPLALLLGGRVTAGFYRHGEFCPDEGRFLEYPDEEPEVRRHLALMAFLGAPSCGEHLEFPLDDDDYESAAPFVPRDRPYACVHPGARASERRWSPAAFAYVADTIAAAGLRVVLTGSAQEAALTHEVADRMHGAAIDTAGRTSLGGLAALVSGARLVVCNDTGVSHIADALRVPSVVITTTSDPRRWAPLDDDRHRVVRAGDPASTVARVASQASQLLAAGAHA